MRLLTTMLTFVLVGWGGGASSETLFSCGSSEGWSRYPENSFISEEHAGWSEDAVSDGSIALTWDGVGADILVKDVAGMMSSRSEGAEVTVLAVDEPFVTVLVQYPKGSIELYTFDSERRTVHWSQHKFGVMIDKAASFFANCN